MSRQRKLRTNGPTFQDKYRIFLRQYGIEFDERYVWD